MLPVESFPPSWRATRCSAVHWKCRAWA